MLRFLGGILVIALLIGAFGYGRGWFTVDPSTENGRSQITFGLDRNKVDEDIRIVQEKIGSKQRSIDEKMLKLREELSRTQGGRSTRRHVHTKKTLRNTLRLPLSPKSARKRNWRQVTRL